MGISLQNVVAANFVATPDALKALADRLSLGKDRLRDIQRFTAKGCRVDKESLPLFKTVFESGQITLLNFERNQLFDPVVEGLVDDILLHNDSLETLCIRSNMVTAAGAEAVARLVDHPTLKVINLKENRIGVDGACALASMLGRNQTLTVMNVRAQVPRLPKPVGLAFAQALSVNGTLRRLKL